MLYKLRIYFIRCLLRWHTHTDEIHSDARNYDCYWIHLWSNEDGEAKFYLCSPDDEIEARSNDPNGVFFRKLRESDSEEKNPAIKLTPSFLYGKRIKVVHYFRNEKLSFKSIEAAFINRILMLPWLYCLLKKALSKIVGFGPRPAASYIEVLKAVCDVYFETGDSSNPYVVALRINGPVFKIMPSNYRSEALEKYRRILESLEESGELKKAGGIFYRTFNPTGKALRTLTDWDDQENERRWQRQHSRQMLGVTFIIGFGTLATAIPELKEVIQKAYEEYSHFVLFAAAVFILFFFIPRLRKNK
ncbi:hypothetical protein [Alloalcanivorax venustensis]|uniref:hypothetical protein n=1 Tax=Alloalcanivorax venustensis TaxID=172371 RepID=UPI00189163A3|nr:hypothetical protein [Alloalcanivorax venustensis]